MANTRSSTSSTPEASTLVLTARQQEIWNFLVAVRRPPRLLADGARDRRARRSCVPVDGARAPREPRARRPPPPRSDEPRALELIGRERREPEPAPGDQGDVARLPLVGEIAAGGPLLAEQPIEEYVPLPASTRGDFLLRVKGESMLDAGILDGDLVIVQRAQDARNGDIVVALAGDDESARRGDRQDVLPRARSRAAAARERVDGADLRRARADPRQGRGSLPGALRCPTSPASPARSTRSSSRCFEARRSSASPAASSSCTRAPASCSAPSAAARRGTRKRSRRS